MSSEIKKTNEPQMKKIILSLLSLTICATINAQTLTEIIKNGNNKLSASNFSGAEEDFSKAIKLNESVVNTYIDKMEKYDKMNEYQKSTSDMPDGFVYKHDLAVPYYGRGMAFAGQGKTTEALSDFEKAIKIDPKYNEAICERGIIYISKGDKEKGCIDLQKAKKQGNEKAKSLFEKNACSDISASFVTAGDIKFSNKDYKGAFEDYNTAVQLNSDSFEAYMKRAKCNIELKKYAKAISDCDKAIKIKNDTVQVFYVRGLAYNASENFSAAFNDFSAVIRIDPNNYDAYIQRGTACEGLQKYRSATYDYTEAIRIRPKDGMGYYKRGLANQDAKDGSACKDFIMAASFGYDDAKPLAEGCKQEQKDAQKQQQQQQKK